MTGRVMHLAWEFPPVIYGGLARHVDGLTRAQQLAGRDVTVVTSAEDVTEPARRIPVGARRRRDVLVLRHRRPLPRRPWSDLLGAARELDDAMAVAAFEHLDAGGPPPEVVHAHDWIGARAARAVADRTGARAVLTVHATEHGRRLGSIGPQIEGGRPAAVHAFERAAVERADAVIVCSAAMCEEVVTVLGADPARVHVVPNAVDPAGWHAGPAAVRAARAHWQPADGSPLVVAAGRIEWEKGFSTILRALPDLRQVHPHLRFVLAGQGSYTPVLMRLAAELGVADRFVLPGRLARRDLAALFAAADVVVVPSRYEPSGLVVREAQAAGAAVVATRTGGIVEAVQDGETGMLIDPGDVHALTDVIALLTAHPAKGRRLGLAAAATVGALTWADVARRTERAYAPEPYLSPPPADLAMMTP